MNTIERLNPMSDRDLMVLGLQEIAYVKPMVHEGQPVFAVHAADGTQIALMADREVAFAAIRQNDLEPLSVH